MGYESKLQCRQNINSYKYIYQFAQAIRVLSYLVMTHELKGLFSLPQVTVFGVGGGATSILAHLVAPTSRGLFHAAWLASPAPLTNNSVQNAHMQNNLLVRYVTR